MGPFFDPGERQGLPASAVLQGAARRARSVTSPTDSSAHRCSSTLLRLGDDRLVLGHRLSRVVRARRRSSRRTSRSRTSRSTSLGQATLLLRARRRRSKARAATKTRSRTSATRSTIRNCAARRAAEGRFRVHDRAPVPVQRAMRCCSSKRCRESANRELAGIAAKALKETPLPRPPQRRVDAQARRRHRREPPRALQSALDDALAIHGRAVPRRRRRASARRAGARGRSSALESRWRAAVTRRARPAPTLNVPEVEVDAARRPAGTPHRAPRPHAGRDADRRARASGRDVVSRSAAMPRRARTLLAVLERRSWTPRCRCSASSSSGSCATSRSTATAVTVTITPTYSGCPAMRVIEQDIDDALKARGIEHVRDPHELLAGLDHRLDSGRGAREAAGLRHRAPGRGGPRRAHRHRPAPPRGALSLLRLRAIRHSGASSARRRASRSTCAAPAGSRSRSSRRSNRGSRAASCT